MRTGILIALGALLLAAQDSAKPTEKKVQVAAAPVKAKAFYAAKTLATKKEGETVVELGTVRAWSRIRWGDDAVAYIPTSAITESKLFISSKKAGSGQGDRAEGTIAARGF